MKKATTVQKDFNLGLFIFTVAVIAITLFTLATMFL